MYKYQSIRTLPILPLLLTKDQIWMPCSDNEIKNQTTLELKLKGVSKLRIKKTVLFESEYSSNV